MGAYRFAETKLLEKELPPICSEECIWYEPCQDSLSCANRHEMICSRHRMEIFNNTAPLTRIK